MVSLFLSQKKIVNSYKSGWVGYDFEQYVKSISNEEEIRHNCNERKIKVSAFKYCTKFLQKKNGVIVFDNSKRIRYSEIFRSGMSYKKFKGYVPTLPFKDETSIFFKN